MSKESSTSGSTKTATAKIADESAGATPREPGSAIARAQAMRADLGARRDVEAMLAEASERSRSAAAEADTMVAEAEVIADQLVTESRQAAAQTTVEAQERADGILARARAEAAEVTLQARTEVENLERSATQERARMREEVEAETRAEFDALRAESDRLLRQVELGVHGLSPALEGAMTVVTDLIGSLEQLRAITPGEAQVPISEAPVEPPVEAPVEAPAATLTAAVVAATETATITNPVSSPEATETLGQSGAIMATSNGLGDDEGARPLGWLFRASQT